LIIYLDITAIVKDIREYSAEKKTIEQFGPAFGEKHVDLKAGKKIKTYNMTFIQSRQNYDPSKGCHP